MKNIKQTFLVILFLSFSFFFVSRAHATGETCAQISGRTAAQCQKGESSGWSGLWATKCPVDMNACAYYNNLQCGSCPTSGDVCCTTDAIVQSATTPNSSAGATTNPLPANQAGARADSTSSGMIPCTNNCTLCHLVIGFKRIFNFFIGLLFVATMLAITVSGVFYMVSSGSKPIIEMAKKGITYSLMAFAIGMGGWLLINTVMIGLGFKHPYGGNWWEFTCDTSQTVGPVSTGNAPNWSTGKTGTGTPNGNCGGLKTQGGSTSQCEQASPEMSSLLQCINNQLGSNSGAWLSLNSINRGRGCHGGGNCPGIINAADIFGNPIAAAEAAKACGTADTILINGKAYYGTGNGQVGNQSDHTDHAHVSVNNKQCGCDWAK